MEGRAWKCTVEDVSSLPNEILELIINGFKFQFFFFFFDILNRFLPSLSFLFIRVEICLESKGISKEEIK